MDTVTVMNVMCSHYFFPVSAYTVHKTNMTIKGLCSVLSHWSVGISLTDKLTGSNIPTQTQLHFI